MKIHNENKLQLTRSGELNYLTRCLGERGRSVLAKLFFTLALCAVKLLELLALIATFVPEMNSVMH